MAKAMSDFGVIEAIMLDSGRYEEGEMFNFVVTKAGSFNSGEDP